MLTHPKSNFSEDYFAVISASRGAALWNFYALENGQSLLTSNGSPICFTIIQKWPKIQRMRVYNFEDRGSNFTKLPRDVPWGRHDDLGTTFGGPNP